MGTDGNWHLQSEYSNSTHKLEPTVPQVRSISSINFGPHVKRLLRRTHRGIMRPPKQGWYMGTNIEGGDRSDLGDCWLQFMRGIGISKETVGNVFDGSRRKFVMTSRTCERTGKTNREITPWKMHGSCHIQIRVLHYQSLVIIPTKISVILITAKYWLPSNRWLVSKRYTMQWGLDLQSEVKMHTPNCKNQMEECSPPSQLWISNQTPQRKSTLPQKSSSWRSYSPPSLPNRLELKD